MTKLEKSQRINRIKFNKTSCNVQLVDKSLQYLQTDV